MELTIESTVVVEDDEHCSTQCPFLEEVDVSTAYSACNDPHQCRLFDRWLGESTHVGGWRRCESCQSLAKGK